jgi:hypothetical protein
VVLVPVVSAVEFHLSGLIGTASYLDNWIFL